MEKRRSSLLFLAAAALSVVLTAMGWWSGRAAAGGSAGDTVASTFPQKGSVVPDLALPALRTDGPPWIGTDTLRLSDFRGRWVYLDVFGSWCPPCRTKQPKMLEIADRLKEEGAMVLGLLLEDSPQTAAEWLAANGGVPYPYLVLDEETKRAWGITGAPMGFLVSPEGRLERLCFGCSRGRDAVGTLPDAIW
ncbi:MAG: TlpA disulfide reductase family protein [Longimicrobiales bacterium]|nr:TlpA disulfide reductase family protein [Longimicrobiales bacterium]